MVSWKITHRNQTNCLKAYRRDRDETVDTNCTDTGVTWASRPDQNPALLIDPVTFMHEGIYSCEMVTTKANFQHDYHLHVPVPLEVSIFQNDTRTVVCKAVSGKPAAWITWTPEGKCVTEQENQKNGGVFVQSTCYWEKDNVSTVTCSVFHWTGIKSLSLELNPGSTISSFVGGNQTVQGNSTPSVYALTANSFVDGKSMIRNNSRPPTSGTQVQRGMEGSSMYSPDKAIPVHLRTVQQRRQLRAYSIQHYHQLGNEYICLPAW
ncbi:PREDICTED: cell surface glycoprotein CD200 receptor 1-like [Chrysochloris asiatica]|uniref:Cell surface glycoprotein CD200 receptor 1-like n=1 Tax=Chrysochloris asiatica TaxID=185453 RepID=A0A9B0WNL7_CHRAS|nr:PREDICTED: cell surface glycoprotein CD200 receptor 1-like [Chrysochloris asiatica]